MKKQAFLALGLILGLSGWSRAGADEVASPVPTAPAVSSPIPTPTATATSTPGISVKDAPYSAYGDGVHDDTAAVSMAFAHAAAQGGGLYFPPGSYKITETILVSASNFVFSGVRGQSILTTDNLTKLLQLKDCSNGTFENISFQATTQDSGKEKGGHSLIVANDAPVNHLNFQGCSFTTPNADMNGVYFVSHSDIPNLFQGIHFTDCDFTHIGRIGAEIQNLSQSKATTQSITDVAFDNCRFTDCGIFTWGMGVSGSAGRYDSGLTVTGCTFDHVKFCAIEAMFNQVLIQGNRFVNAGSDHTSLIHVTPKEFNLNGFNFSQNECPDGTYNANFLWNCSAVRSENNRWATRGRAFFLRDDSDMIFSNDTIQVTGGAAIMEDRPCLSTTFSNCQISNNDGWIVNSQTGGDSGITLEDCTLSTPGGQAFKLPRGGTLHAVNNTLNGQIVSDMN